MQKKYSSELESGEDNVILTTADLHSIESLKTWIKDKLGLKQDFDKDTISSAIEGIIRDPKFIKNTEENKKIILSDINNLVNNIKISKE